MATNHAPDIEKEIRQALRRLEAVRDRRLPVAVGTEAVEYVRGNFRAGGIDGRKWKEPLRRALSFHGAEGRYGPLLSRTDTLMGATRKRTGPGRVVIENRQPYAAIHNAGGTVAVTARMKKYFWWRYLQIEGSKGGKGRRPLSGRYTVRKDGRRGDNKYNRSMGREAQFWKAMALKRVGSRIRIPQRMFIGDTKGLRRVVDEAINKELQQYVKDYGRSFGRSH